MDNQFTRLDSYGRIVGVPVYPGVSTNPDVKQPETEPVWARAERVKKLENEIERAKTHIYNLRERVKILEITPLVPVEDHSSTWVEEELEAIKNMPSERICSGCKWGNILGTKKGGEGEVDCHYEPHTITHLVSWWCSKWSEK